jgi:RNA polymerase sigma-70 factor (ECF subfamily)
VSEQRKADAPDDAGTLGDLLYADRSRPRVAEKDWVALVRSIGAGDQRALHALFERSHHLVFTLTLRIVRRRESAEEVTLDVFHDLWRNASEYDPSGGTVLGWIMNQARSRAIDRLRYEQRKKRTAPLAADAASEAAAHAPDDALEVAERGRSLRRAVALLTPGEREAIETAFFSDLTHVEVATRLNQPLGTIKTRIRSGLDKLRRALASEGKGP